MSNSKDLAHGSSTWSVASYEDIVVRFQQDVQDAEDKDGYEDALAICLKSMRRLESTDLNKLTDEQKLELRYYHGQALNRSQFLFDSMMLSNKRFTEKLSVSTPTTSPSLAINQLCFGEMTNTKPSSVQSKEAFKHAESNVLDCTTADEDIEEELDTSKLESTSFAMPIKKQNTKLTRMSKEDKELRQAVLDNVVKETPKIQFSDVIGLEKAKFALQDAVVVPLAFPDSPQAKNAWTGILLYGVSEF
jgi:SpoVK/Ycf46/Vps4 family AAA+-type ATPase